MGIPFFYRRPEPVPKDLSYNLEKADSGSLHRLSRFSIPEALSFDNIINNATCPPCTTRDFMNYLIYIERSAENLQFYLWFRSYSKRFATLAKSDAVLSPEWHERSPADMETRLSRKAPKPLGSAVSDALKEADFLQKPPSSPNPFTTPPPSTDGDNESISSSTVDISTQFSSGPVSTLYAKTAARELAAEAFDDANRLQPFTIQPFREEIDRIIAIYIKDDSPRQLNLAAKERKNLIHALSQTTHPSAFKQTLGTVEFFLRHQAHPNFIRWTVSNSNPSRNLAIRSLGAGSIIGGLVMAVLLTLSTASRGWRAMSAVLLLMGISNSIANTRDTCMILHLRKHRHLHPWELFSDDSEELKDIEPLSGGTNSYEDQPWLAKYEQRSFAARIFDGETAVEEPAVFRIQRRIVLESVVVGFLITAVIVIVFCFLPGGNFY